MWMSQVQDTWYITALEGKLDSGSDDKQIFTNWNFILAHRLFLSMKWWLVSLDAYEQA